MTDQYVSIPANRVVLEGDLTIPTHPSGVVLFAHGSGSSRKSTRNRFVARTLNERGLATFLMDLLTEAEEWEERTTRHFRFDIDLLANRLASAIDWLGTEPATRNQPLGIFGASTGGGAALVAAAQRPNRVGAVVSRGGRPDLAGSALDSPVPPTLLIVGGLDLPVIELNRSALARIRSERKQLVIVPGATHLFEEPGTLEEVARLASDWFDFFLPANPPPRPRWIDSGSEKR